MIHFFPGLTWTIKDKSSIQTPLLQNLGQGYLCVEFSYKIAVESDELKVELVPRADQKGPHQIFIAWEYTEDWRVEKLSVPTLSSSFQASIIHYRQT